MLKLSSTRHPSRAPGAAQRPSEVLYWVDHTVAFETNTGMQRVTRLLAKSLKEQGVKLVFVCWDSRKKSLRRARAAELRALAKHGGPVAENLPGRFSGGRALSPEETAGRWLFVPEVTHITYHRRPVTADVFDYAARRGLKTAFIFYDAVPLRTPGYEKVRPVHEEYMRELAKADLVLPISEFSAQELRDFWGASRAEDFAKVRARVLPGEFLGVPRVRRYEEKQGPVRALCVGSIEPRKNHLALLSAFERLCAESPALDIELALIGNVSPEMHLVVAKLAKKNPRLRYLGYASDASLLEHYERAHFTVFPSISEGFGLPILESLWHGKPCVCANFGAMAEVGRGGGCLMIDTHFASELHGAIKRLATDEELRRRLGREAVERPIKSWRDYAAEIAGELGVAHAGLRLG